MGNKFNIYQIPKSLTNRKPAIIFVVAVVALAAFLTFYIYFKRPESIKNIPTVGMDSLYIFVPKDGIKLAQYVLEVKADISEKQKADEIMNEMKRQKCLSERLTLYDFATDEDGVMYLNFSKELLNDKPAGSSREITMTYAIVNTFISNFRNINKIQLLVEGHPTETINGVVYIYKPLEFKKDLMED